MISEISTLPNGIRVITSSRPEIESVSLGIWVNTGAAYEKPQLNGISHFLEHMVFKGTKTRNAFEISDQFEDVGGQSNAYTAREFTAFYAKMLKADTELAIDILADLINNPTFPVEELVKEREVVVQEIKQGIDTPDDIIFDFVQEQAFPNQALGRTILGPAEKVRSFGQEELQGYLKSNYSGENMVVCAVGNIEHKQFVEMVKSRLGGFQAKAHFDKDVQSYRGGFMSEKRDIEQAHVVLAFNGVRYECETYYPCQIFSTIFGGGMSSRLFREVREKRGLVYSVYSFSNSHTQSGLFGIYAGTTNKELQELTPVIGTEIKKICNDLVSPQELSRAKSQLKASMLMALESSSTTAEILARQMLLYNRIIPIEEMVERIEKVTLQDVRDMAQQIFASKPTYCLVGDIANHPDYEQIQHMIKG